jgi:hypothetical protein
MHIMPAKRKATRTKRPALTKKQIAALHKQYIMAGGAQTGMGFLDWINTGARAVYNAGKKVYDTGKKVHNWVKDNKVISRVADTASIVIPGASSVAKAAQAEGYGRVRRQRGGAVMGSTVNARRVMRF